MQSTNTVLMVEPVRFFANPSTKVDNLFQKAGGATEPEVVQKRALQEFHGLRKLLEDAGVTVRVWQDVAAQETPDSIFPNNWFSTHEKGTLVLYPMRSIMRRAERRADIIASLREGRPRLIDLTGSEAEGRFLEGTGSLVLDRIGRVAYACASPRTDSGLLDRWAAELGYSVCRFDAFDGAQNPIYHTNVLMSVGTGYAVVCLDAIEPESARGAVATQLAAGGRTVVSISRDQMDHFCGNVLEVRGARPMPLLVMSTAAYDAFTPLQRETLSRFATLLHTPLFAIEEHGGGGARCMLAELFPA
jgi:hypothetical protein